MASAGLIDLPESKASARSSAGVSLFRISFPNDSSLGATLVPRLLLVAFLSLATIGLPELAWGEPAATDGSVSVFLVGDSTVCDYRRLGDPTTSPMAGWGQMLQPLLEGEQLEELRPLISAPRAVVKNHAIGGRTTRSFFEEGRWRRVYNELNAGDLVLIQFGHNDASIRLPEVLKKRGYPEFVDLGYKEFLRLFVSQSREKGAVPILVTPVARNYPWKDGVLTNAHKGFPDSVQAVADEMGVPLLDLNERSMAFFTEKGEEHVTRTYFMNLEPGAWEKHPDGLKDNTHFQNEGATEVARLVHEGLVEIAETMGGEGE